MKNLALRRASSVGADPSTFRAEQYWVAGRYRIVSLIGKGGMGEVYRADDLKLGQTVALKFLPKDFAQDPKRLENFHSEVRLTRQISHPNVCRVFDIAEVDGQHFLSMEYVDGEDLQGLLRWIGRLPKQKGIEITQQLCAGLAAAHELGVLHRDLKPANIMLDGRGRVRITDFGLAISTSDQTDGEFAGTPAYMAPEQLRHWQTTVRSDLYSLGLILYELFTGKSAHPKGRLRDLLRAREESSPSAPSQFVEDMDPAVERVILRCLVSEPHERPESALAIAAALPGGDPLAAALATGETPSPEMVAAAGKAGKLPISAGIATLVSVVALLVCLCSVADQSRLINLAPMERSPESLKDESKSILARLHVETRNVSSSHGFVVSGADLEAVGQIQLPSDQTNRLELLESSPWPGVQFWYRQSPQPLFANHFWAAPAVHSHARVTAEMPAWEQPEMAGVWLSPRGELR